MPTVGSRGREDEDGVRTMTMTRLGVRRGEFRGRAAHLGTYRHADPRRRALGQNAVLVRVLVVVEMGRVGAVMIPGTVARVEHAGPIISHHLNINQHGADCRLVSCRRSAL